MTGKHISVSMSALGIASAAVLVLTLVGVSKRYLPPSNSHANAASTGRVVLASAAVVARKANPTKSALVAGAGDLNVAVRPSKIEREISQLKKKIRAATKTLKSKQNKYNRLMKIAQKKNASNKQRRRANNAAREVNSAGKTRAKLINRLRKLFNKLQAGNPPRQVGTRAQIERGRKLLRLATGAYQRKHAAYKKALKRAKKRGAGAKARKAAHRAYEAYRKAAKRRNAIVDHLRALLRPRPRPKRPSPEPKPSAKPRPRVVPQPTRAPRPPRGYVRVNGKRLARHCYCKRAPAGQSACYDFIEGSKRMCKRRTCAASYVCVGKRQAKGATCFLRRVRYKVVSAGGYTCRRKREKSYMYVPYSK